MTGPDLLSLTSEELVGSFGCTPFQVRSPAGSQTCGWWGVVVAGCTTCWLRIARGAGMQLSAWAVGESYHKSMLTLQAKKIMGEVQRLAFGGGSPFDAPASEWHRFCCGAGLRVELSDGVAMPHGG